MKIDNAFIKELISSMFERLEEYYVFPNHISRMRHVLDEKQQRGDYSLIRDAEELGTKLTQDLFEITNDRHLRITFNSSESLEEEVEPFEVTYVRGIEKENYGFYRVERLPGNIGYIDLRNFHMLKYAGEVASHAMNFIAHTDALIIDLRNNGGGFSDMVSFVISYLIGPDPVHLNDFYLRENNSTKQFWSFSYVPGKRFGEHKPIYILTSKKTFSAAEQFAYCLKFLKRATLVGEQTGGGANPASMYSLIGNFSIFVPDGRAIHPVTKDNWEGTGVEPDISCLQSEAYEWAYQQSLSYVIDKYCGDTRYEFLYEEAKRNQDIVKP